MDQGKINVGVLALQGAYAEHIKMLQELGVNAFEIRQLSDLSKPFDGLILPGGESTVMGKLLHELNLYDKLKEKIVKGMPVFGTCAGMILLASELDGDSTKHFATMDITVKRNGYGRQLGSFNANQEFDGTRIPMTFIRAPYITRVGENVKVLATVDDKVVAARQQNQLAIAFHPEVTKDTFVHQYFINMIKSCCK